MADRDNIGINAPVLLRAESVSDIDIPNIDERTPLHSVTPGRDLSTSQSSQPGKIATKRDIAMMVLVNFLSASGYSIILPSLWPFILSLGGPQSVVGWAVAANSAGQFLSSPLLGWWGDKVTIKQVLVITLIMAVGSNIIYATSKFYWTLLIARFFIGFAGGNSAAANSYLTYATSEKYRVMAFTINTGFTVLGFVIGPALGMIGTIPLFPISIRMGHFYSIELNENTIPGYIGAILNLVAVIAIIFLFNEIQKAKEKPSYNPYPTPWLGVAVLLYLNFAFTIYFTVFETIGTAYTSKAYDWGVRNNSIMWAGLSFSVILAVAFVIPLERIFNERIVMILSDIFFVAGTAVLVSFKHQFVSTSRWLSGVAVATFGFGITQVVVNSIYTKILEGLEMGKFMGYMNSSASVARILAPIFAGYLFEFSGGIIIFTSLTVLMGFSTIVNLIFYRRLAPHAEYAKYENDKKEKCFI